MTGRRFRPVWAEVDLGALRHNVALLRRVAAPAALCVVVKADAYGHGATAVAAAAVEAGADRLAVALVEEGVELREAGITAPILLLSEPPAGAHAATVAATLTPTLYTKDGIAEAAAAAATAGVRHDVHLKVDTGMHRVGADLNAVPGLAAAIDRSPALRLEGFWTHLAVADGASTEDHAFTARQLDRFAAAASALSESGVRPPVLHAANSAGAIAWPAARFDLVRCGIAVYGELPSRPVGEALAAMGEPLLRPVLSLKARVSAVRELDAGERPSYGRLRPLPARSTVATIPAGYADGVPRALFAAGGSVLIGGRRCPLAGMVTMDQILVDCGPDAPVRPGDEAVLIGCQGREQITASEWADCLGTISYEVLCAIGPRVPRLVVPGATAGGRAARSAGPGGSGVEGPGPAPADHR